MTEQQLRDVLARVVPEPPDSVADPTPVVRVARRRRTVRVAGVGALAAVVIAGTAFGVASLRSPGDEVQVADGPTGLPAVYDTLECPDPDETWDNSELLVPDQIVAVRYCARGTGSGFPVPAGPGDALVTGTDEFVSLVAGLPDADPARCAAVDPIPSDSRLLLQLEDGGLLGVPATMCSDVAVDGRTVDGADVTAAFLEALGHQRDAYEYAPEEVAAPADCSSTGISPATPAREHLVAAVACTGSGTLSAIGLAADETARLDEAWRAASLDAPNCGDPGLAPTTILARTDRGDLVRLDPMGCGQYTYYASDQTQYLVTFTYEDNTSG